MTMGTEIKNLLAQPDWHNERKKLRSLARDCGLEERVKWGKLCYGLGSANVVIIYGMKNYCALGFFKGALLEDEDHVLVPPGKHSQAMRQLRFKSLEEIEQLTDVITSFIRKAVQAEKNGLKIDFKEKHCLDYPEEFQEALAEDPELAEAFKDLTSGRQRGYVLYISDAKQSETRARRVERIRPRILQGKGFNER
ncbi:YdeI/OmpD-associated family protein [Hoeflea sp. AS16]|uniref:YdeI/OmpD-associated family protein n=1 Tax=Hoeflea sp. AS16 TaxID=3135779 RepID=UPI00316E28B7